MNDLKPYSYLYKRETAPKILRSCFVLWVPVGKKLTGPTITPDGDITTIQYDVEHDNTQLVARQEEYVNELNWDGRDRTVHILIGDVEGKDTSSISSTAAEDL